MLFVTDGDKSETGYTMANHFWIKVKYSLITMIGKYLKTLSSWKVIQNQLIILIEIKDREEIKFTKHQRRTL